MRSYAFRSVLELGKMGMGQTASDGEVHALLRAFPPVVGETAQAVMAVIERTDPGLEGLVRDGLSSIDYRHYRAGSVCAVFPMRDQVMLVFEHGEELRHPLLEGDSAHARWIRFRPEAELPEDDVATLVAEAIALRA